MAFELQHTSAGSNLSWELGLRQYLTGVGIFNNPDHMQAIHAVEVIDENKDRLGKVAYSALVSGSLAVLDTTLRASRPQDELEKRYRNAQFKHGSNISIAGGLMRMISDGTFGEAVRLMRPSGFMRPIAFERLFRERTASVDELMDGIGVHPFFDDWEPVQIQYALGSGSDDSGEALLLPRLDEPSLKAEKK